jgi:hypothetical protein
MKKVLCILLLSCFFSSFISVGARAEDLEASRIIKEIKVKGAKSVLAGLTSKYMTRFKEVCDKIESGKNEWLVVASLLAPASDGSATLDLEYSVALALPKEPRQVLAVLAETEHDPGGAFLVDNVCLSPYIEPEPGVAEKYLLDTEKALESTDTSDNPRLNRLRLKCLKNIRKEINYCKKNGLWQPK